MFAPLIDLREQHKELSAQINQAIAKVFSRADFILGEEVQRFEEEFANYCGVKYGVGVDSGSSALELGLRAFGIGDGDEVIVPANTFIATAAAVSFTGAKPVFVDVDPRTYNINVNEIEKAITSATKAIIPVHLYGLPADMNRILEIAQKANLIVLEDACQAHGAYYHGRPIGCFGHAAAFSFYPTKNLGGCGDGGMLVTNDFQIAEKVRAMRNCGQKQKYIHEYHPSNHRLDTLQAAILRIKLRYLERWIEARRIYALFYSHLLEDSHVIPPFEPPESRHVYHLFVIRTPKRDEIQAFLREKGIGTAIHYPIPLHLQPYYQSLAYKKGDFPVTEVLSGQILSLPMYPEMTVDQVCFVVDQITNFFRQSENQEFELLNSDMAHV